MKVPKTDRKFILCLVLALAIVGTFLVPATIATAATQDWPLTLVGARTLTVGQAQFEAMAAANPASWTDNNSNVWTGVAMWRLVALVDDSDNTTFNSGAVNVCTVQETAFDNFTASFAGSILVSSVSSDNNVMLANKENGSPLTGSLYPLRAVGPGIGGPTGVKNKQTVSGLVNIQLLNLPVTNVSVSPASQAVANGGSFTVGLAVSSNRQVRGWQANVDFDATKMSCTAVAEGTFLSAYATANGGGTISGGAVTIDNSGGHVAIPGYSITGAGSGGPDGTGTLCTLSMTAKSGVDNYASLAPSGAIVTDNTGVTIPGTTVTGGTVAIGNVPIPDLVVSALSTTKIDDATYTINYTIKNQGNASAGATITSIVVDAGTPITIACPALSAGASDTKTTVAQTYSAPNDVVVVTADSTGVVAEGNESNNARQLVYAKAGDQGSTAITSGIDAKLVLAVPAAFAWQLHQGQNVRTGLANVKCNTPWQLQVSDDNLTTVGHMTPWDGSNYVSGNRLASAMQVGCQTGPYSLPSGGTIATGVVSGQNGDNGQDLTVSFNQQVLYSDQANGVTYHIVVTFTASSSF